MFLFNAFFLETIYLCLARVNYIQIIAPLLISYVFLKRFLMLYLT